MTLTLATQIHLQQQPSFIRQESTDSESPPPLKQPRPLFSAHGLFLDPLDAKNHKYYQRSEIASILIVHYYRCLSVQVGLLFLLY